MLIIYGNEQDWTQQAASAMTPVLKAHEVFGDSLRDAGAFVSAEALQPSSTVTTIRLKDNEPLLTDGPYIESKEQIGGFYLIDVEDLDQALDWARQLAHIEQNPIEVWPVWE